MLVKLYVEMKRKYTNIARQVTVFLHCQWFSFLQSVGAQWVMVNSLFLLLVVIVICTELWKLRDNSL